MRYASPFFLPFLRDRVEDMEIHRWKKLGVPKILAEGFGKSLTEQHFLDHRGKEVNFFFFDQPDWSVVLPITKDKRVLLVRQYKQGAEEILEELPGGTANFHGELPEAVMQRELKEELGYVAEKIISLGKIRMNSRNSRTNAHCFLALGCVQSEEAHPDLEEELDPSSLSLDEWLERVFMSPHEVEWDSLVVTLRALPHLDLRGTRWDLWGPREN